LFDEGRIRYNIVAKMRLKSTLKKYISKYKFVAFEQDHQVNFNNKKPY